MVTGTLTLACGQRLSYDDSNLQHRRLRLQSTLPRPQVDCPDHGPEDGLCAVSGPASELWPDPIERRQILAELHATWADEPAA